MLRLNLDIGDIIIEVKDVSMRFRLPTEKIDSLKEYVLTLAKRKLKYEEFWALKDVSFSVRKGESLALIGRNGAGKSTLLKLISGIMEPTSGKVTVKGSLVPLLKLGAGFDMNATGKENVFLGGALLGYSKREMFKKYDRIVEFAELKDFMSLPLKNYSNGMLTRLGFAVAVDDAPDIMLIDEVLAVGDAPFRKKCAEKIDELKAKGTTFIVVSHSMSEVKRLTENAIYLQNGQVKLYGDTKSVVDAYIDNCTS